MDDFMRVINGWHFDCVCLWACDEFREYGAESFTGIVDTLEACLKNEMTGSPCRTLQMLLLKFLINLSYLSNPSGYFNSDSKRDPKLILKFFYYILIECPKLNEARCLDLDIVQQVIFSFCRTSDFKYAKQLYDSVLFQKVLKTSNPSIETKRLVYEIATVLGRKDIHHSALRKYSFENFIVKMQSFVENVLDFIPGPYLVDLYRKSLNGKSTSESEANEESTESEEKVEATPNASPPNSPVFDEQVSFVGVVHSNNKANEDISTEDSEDSLSSESSQSPEIEASETKSISESSTQQEKIKKMFDYFYAFKTGEISEHCMNMSQTLSESEIDYDLVIEKIRDNFKKMGAFEQLAERCEQIRLAEEKSEAEKVEPVESKHSVRPGCSKTSGDDNVKCDSVQKRIVTPSYPTCRVECIRAEQDPGLSSELGTKVRIKSSSDPSCRVQCIPVELDPGLSNEFRAEVRQELGRLSPAKGSPIRRTKRKHTSDEETSCDSMLESTDLIMKTPERSPLKIPDFRQTTRFSEIMDTGKIVINEREKVQKRGHTRKKQWSEKETYQLFRGVKKYGVGKWSFILHEFKFKNRTSINLSDKWRNLKKNDKMLKELEDRYLKSSSQTSDSS